MLLSAIKVLYYYLCTTVEVKFKMVNNMSKVSHSEQATFPYPDAKVVLYVLQRQLRQSLFSVCDILKRLRIGIVDA